MWCWAGGCGAISARPPSGVCRNGRYTAIPAQSAPSVPTFALFRAEDDVVVRGAGGDHGVHLLLRADPEVDDDRTVVDRVGLLDGRDHVLGVLDPHAHAPHGFGPHLVVRQVGREV